MGGLEARRDVSGAYDTYETATAAVELAQVGVTVARQNYRMQELRYRSGASGEETERVVDPYGMVYREGRWYAVGYCHLRTDLLAAAQRQVPDAFVIDIGLPDSDGRDVCQALRARGIDAPVLFLTARGAEWLPSLGPLPLLGPLSRLPDIGMPTPEGAWAVR